MITHLSVYGADIFICEISHYFELCATPPYYTHADFWTCYSSFSKFVFYYKFSSIKFALCFYNKSSYTFSHATSDGPSASFILDCSCLCLQLHIPNFSNISLYNIHFQNSLLGPTDNKSSKKLKNVALMQPIIHYFIVHFLAQVQR